MMDIEPYQKYFTGKNPDLLGYTIIGIASALKLYCPKAPKPPPAQAFDKILFACDRLDEQPFEAACLWAFKLFFDFRFKNVDAAWLEIARLIETKTGEELKPVIESTPQGSPGQAIEETLPSPETPEETKPQLPLLKKAFSLKIAMRLCVAWMLDPRWQELSPCAKLLFYWLIFRTYRKETFLKIKQALARAETYFPWCCTGIKSLSKQLTYRCRLSKKLKHYEDCQIKRALRQLWDLGFIHRIFRGYKDQGAGKYHVFLNPSMSATFNQARVKTKQGATPKKRHSRMS